MPKHDWSRRAISVRITLSIGLDSHLSVQDVPEYGLVFPFFKDAHFVVAHPFAWKVSRSPGRPRVRGRDPGTRVPVYGMCVGRPVAAFGRGRDNSIALSQNLGEWSVVIV